MKNNFLSFTHLFFYCKDFDDEKKHIKKKGENAEKRKKSLKNLKVNINSK